MLNRTGKDCGACLKNNVSFFCFWEQVLCTIQAHVSHTIRAHDLAHCNIWCWFLVFLCKSGSSEMQYNGRARGWSEITLLLGHNMASMDNMGMDCPCIATSFSHARCVLHRLALSLEGCKMGYNESLKS